MLIKFIYTYNVDILNSFNAELQLNTEPAIRDNLNDLRTELRLVIELKKIEIDDATKYSTFYSNSKGETVINESDIDDVFQPISSTVTSNIQNSLGKSSGRIIDSVVNHTINISEYNPLAGSSYIRLPKELDNPKK